MAPKQKPGNSYQSYRTPPEFLAALKRRLNVDEFIIDLAATRENMVALACYTEEEDSLSDACPWTLGMENWCYCNPPYGHIRPWVKKAYESSQQCAKIAVLVPASVGSNWWRDWVHHKAYVLFLNGRLAFIPEKPNWLYPKDLAVLLYRPEWLADYDVWPWRKDV